MLTRRQAALRAKEVPSGAWTPGRRRHLQALISKLFLCEQFRCGIDTFYQILRRAIAMSMITAAAWVPRGAAAEFPVKYDIDEEELARISALAKLQLQDARDDLEASQNNETDEANPQDSQAEEESDNEERPAST